jgi:DNA-binding NarL/FixJ family response regulator
MSPMGQVLLRVLLVDDHEVVRSGIAAMLKATEDIVVAARPAPCATPWTRQTGPVPMSW